MNTDFSGDGVWFVYDGDCLLCQSAALAMRLKEELGSLHLVNARSEPDHPLMRAIRDRALDLDVGMVIYHQDQFHHGDNALAFMAAYGGEQGLYNRLNRWLFRSPRFSKLAYPWLRATRNLLLLLRGKSQIRNLQDPSQPTFQPIFGSDWDRLPPVMKRHYANRPFSQDHDKIEGTMTVETGVGLRLLAPLSRLLGGVPLVTARNIPVTVGFVSETNSAAFHFDRLFHLPNQRPHRFHSKMIPRGGNRLVEQMKFGLGWCVAFTWTGKKVLLHHEGYCLCLLGQFIPLPLDWLLGKPYAEEEPLDKIRFRMFVRINHWLFGKIYEYRGHFRINDP